MTVRQRETVETLARESAERLQREHELQEALSAARHLQARLEMLGGHDETIAVVRRISEDLAGHLVVTDDLHSTAR